MHMSQLVLEVQEKGGSEETRRGRGREIEREKEERGERGRDGGEEEGRTVMIINIFSLFTPCRMLAV